MPLPAHGKNSRGGRRGSAASSPSYTSTITMAVFVGLCLLGVYKLTSSTSTISHPPHHHLQRNAVSSNQSPPRSVLRDNPSSDPLDDTQGELPEDAVKGDETSQENQEKVRSQSVGTTEEDVAAAAAATMVRPQQEEEVETNRVSEEIKQQQDQNQENGRINAEEQQQMSEGELGANHEGTLQIIEQVTSGNHDAKSEEGGGGGDKDIDNQSLSGQIPKSEDGEDKGITSQSQIEHDADGTTDNQQQQQQQQQDEQQQQQQEEEQQKLEQQQQQQQQQEEEQQPQQQQQAAGENNQQVEENPNPSEAIPDESKVAVPDKSNGDKKTWEMQADQSSNEKEKRDENEPLQSNGGGEGEGEGEGDSGKLSDQGWELCNVTAGPDYIPCLDNEKAIKQLRSFRHYEHRERHCPDESPTCLVPLPNGYKRPIEWPQSRDRVKARV